MKYVTNAVGREVSTEINGEPVIPFKGVGKHKPEARKYAPPVSSCADFPSDGDKRVGSLALALEKAGLTVNDYSPEQLVNLEKSLNK